MNKIQKEVLKELKQVAVNLGHSPRKKEITPSLFWSCYTHFLSFNDAKKKAGLDISCVRSSEISEELLNKDLDLVKIIALINFDGHLDKKLRSFYYSSKNIKDITSFEDIIQRKFNIKSRIKENTTGSKKQTNICWVFNSKLAKELNELGVVEGAKITKSYLIPEWITSNKEYSREFLKMAFFCEGSNKEETKRKQRIRFSMHKSERLIGNGIKFINQLKEMLSKFDIKTTPVYISNGKKRKDGIETKLIAFRIAQEDINKFINEIRWIK